MWPSEKALDCGCKLSLECKQTNTCNFLADAWRPWHVHMNSDTHTHRGNNSTCVSRGGFYTRWTMKKDLDDITPHHSAVTDSNSELRLHTNLNHLMYCCRGCVGGGGGRWGRGGHTDGEDEREMNRRSQGNRESVKEINPNTDTVQVSTCFYCWTH